MSGLELNPGSFRNGIAVGDFEEVPLVEAKLLRENVVGENLDPGIELAHSTVVEATGSLHFVFRVDKLTLELQEVLAGLQLRIRFGYGKDAFQRFLHHVLGFTRFGGALGAQRGGTRLGDTLKHFPLVGGVALDGVDEVRDEVRAALELDGDVAPRLVDSNIQRHQAVVGHPQVDSNNDGKPDDDGKNDSNFHASSIGAQPWRSKKTFCAPAGTRTPTVTILSRLPLPIGLPGPTGQVYDAGSVTFFTVRLLLGKAAGAGREANSSKNSRGFCTFEMLTKSRPQNN